MNTGKKLYQWDTGQKLTGCTGLYVDFPIDNEVYRIETADGTCIIPDELLQTSGGHKVYECMTNNTIRSFAFSVTPRPKPPDYVYTPTERLAFEGLVQKVDDVVADMIRRAESGEFDGHTPVKGTDYFTTEEIQQIQNEVSSGAIGEFKSVGDTETDKFNANATEKLNAYNSNAGTKLNAYNTNANNRVAEFDSHTEQIQTDISELKSDLVNLPYINIFDGSKITEGKYIKPDGSYGEYATWNYTDKMDIYSDASYEGLTVSSSTACGAYYDEYDTFISSFTQSESAGKHRLEEIPSNAKYVRFSVATIDIANFKYTVFKDLIRDNSITKSKIAFDLFDVKKEYWDLTKFGEIVERTYIKSDVSNSSDGYFTIKHIPVEPNTQYYANSNLYNDTISTYARFVNYYDADGNFLDGGNDDYLRSPFTTPDNCYYITVSIAYLTYDDTSTKGNYWMSTTKDNHINIIEPIDGKWSRDSIHGLADAPSIWNGKNYISHGDSITWRDGHDWEDGTEAVGYQSIMNQQIGFASYNNQGWSGHSMADGTSNGDGCVTRILSLDHSQYDLCTIACGTNDFKLNVPLGTLGIIGDTDFDRTTFYGAYRTAIEYLLNQKPTLRIVLFTPLQRDNSGYDVNYTNSAGHKLIDYVNAIKELGKMYGLPVCDMYANSGFTKLTLATYTVDGLHPNNVGYVRMGNYATQFVNSIGC